MHETARRALRHSNVSAHWYETSGAAILNDRLVARTRYPAGIGAVGQPMVHGHPGNSPLSIRDCPGLRVTFDGIGGLSPGLDLFP